MEWPVIFLLVLAPPFLLLPIAVTAYLQVGDLYQAIRRARVKEVIPELTGSTGANCPPGYVGVNGKCVPAA